MTEVCCHCYPQLSIRRLTVMTETSQMFNKYLRSVVLVILVLQTSLTVLFLRYSRTNNNGQPFIPTTVVFMTECLKYILCLALLVASTGWSLRDSVSLFKDEIVLKPRETFLLSVPACLYTMQNNLLIIALSNLDAATYQVTYQLKILTTAGFSVLLLKKQLHRRQWLALILLMMGVTLVQLTGTEDDGTSDQNRILGFSAVLIACFSSGYAGVYYEKLVKHSSQPSIVIRNLQLGIFSLIFSFSGMVYYSSAEIFQHGMFYGYTAPVWSIIILQSIGGLVVAATIKFADNILKGFATSISIIVSTLCSWYVLEDLVPGPYFLFGTSIVMSASLLYGLPLSELCGWHTRHISPSLLPL